jgi:hypothetical protein
MTRTTQNQGLIKICKHQYRNPIYLARQWQIELAEGKYSSRANLSREFGVSRARVTQVLNLLKLPREIIEKAITLGDPLTKPIVTERNLRPLSSNTSLESEPMSVPNFSSVVGERSATAEIPSQDKLS